MIKFRNIVMMFALILVVSLCGCGGDNTPKEGRTTPTPQGLTIQTTTPIDMETKLAMEKALTDLFAEARMRGYTQRLNHSDYIIKIRTDCTDRGGVMGWQENVPDYGGVIWQAERVEISGSKVQSFQICKDSVATMANTTRYGAEHIILYFNDKPEFERTKVHTTPELGHPIIR